MRKTRKVMELNDGGVHLVVIKHFGESNPFRLYEVWFDRGWHRREITRYADMFSIIWHVQQIVRADWKEVKSQAEEG